MKSKHDAIKEFNRAFNRYWRAEWMNAQERKFCSNEKHEELLHKLDAKWKKLIDLKVKLNKLDIIYNFDSDDSVFMPYEFNGWDWASVAVIRQNNYFSYYPERKDFLFMKSKRKHYTFNH
jgi:hypothetical protein